MKKRTAVRFLSFSIALFLVSVGFLYMTLNRNERFKLEVQNGYAKNLEEFSAGINNISLALKKAKYISTPEQVSRTAAKIFCEAEITKNALSQLPYYGELSLVNKFLSQVGNYAIAVSESLVSTGNMNENDKLNISELSATAEKIAKIVSDTRITYNNLDYWAKELNDEIGSSVDEESLESSLMAIEDELEDYPTLIYDGPYSDHLLKHEPLMLKNATIVSEEEAKEKAALLLESDKAYLKYDGSLSGEMPAYRFTAKNATVAVSKAGGYGIYMRKERDISNGVLSYEQAVQKAKNYLRRIGYSSFKETYYFTDEGICVVNFAYIDGSTICYTDLLKVGVAMDSGEIMLYEASGYLSNHTDRTFPTAKYSVEQARELLSNRLKVKEMSTALIPTDSGEERCYEFLCLAEDESEVLVYINVSTLEEEELLILLKSDGGTLVK